MLGPKQNYIITREPEFESSHHQFVLLYRQDENG